MSRVRRFLLAAAMLLTLQATAALPAVHAASATDAQNPDLAVSLTVPDQASVGDTVAATISISNTSARLQTFQVKGIWLDPAGEETVQARTGLLLPGQTITREVDYKLDERSIPGTHQITLTVEGRSGTSSATAAVEVSGVRD